MKTRIVVFDDNDTRRDGLKLLIDLTPEMECVGAFNDCRDVIKRIEVTQPDVILMDIDMPNVNGIEGLKILRKEFPELKILMQTVFEDDDKIFACIQAGADGYILKKASPQDLIKGIEDIMNGGAAMTPSVARQVLRLVNNNDNKQENKSDTFRLTDRETEILGHLVKGMSYKMIADKCNISLATINTHIRHIYEKLQVNSGTEAVAKAIEHQIIKLKK